MEALHAAGGVPPGWRFTLPAGDARAGRQAFVDFKCYACHAVRGERFPLQPGEPATAGPDLTGMGSHHPAEYLAESILNPSAVLVDRPGYIGGDGRSIMPSYPQMTAIQLIDLVAYLKSLGEAGGGHGHAGDRPHEKSVGGYRVRLYYRSAHEGHEGHHAAGSRDRLMAFVTLESSGQPVPYLPVSARIQTSGHGARTVKLGPALAPEGFHYGVDVSLPEATSRITLTIGATVMRLLPGSPEGIGRAQTLTFDWK
jgi:mono/diheme cytochrome c family protein